jgi:hypothetical protein
MITVHIRRHEVIPKCGSFGVRYSDGRPSQYFYWEDVPGRRLRPDLVTSDVALEQAKALARAERSPSETCPVCNRVEGDQVPELSEGFGSTWTKRVGATDHGNRRARRAAIGP